MKMGKDILLRLRRFLRFISVACRLQFAILMVISLYAKGANAMGKALIKREGHKIIFQGPIEEDSYERLAAVFVPGIKTLVINSGGGSVSVGLKIGEFIRRNGLSVEVQQRCYSSCANYIFTGATLKTLQPGSAVCFHGDSSTTPALSKLEFTRLKIANKLFQIVDDQEYQAYLKKEASEKKNERAFYEGLGIKLSIINDDRRYPSFQWRCPSEVGFKRLGIKNVKGSPDPSQLLDDSREKQTILKFNGLDEIEERACGKIVRKLFRDGICAPRIPPVSGAIAVTG
jgi:ATP-dependent protease ClpP protease subunit